MGNHLILKRTMVAVVFMALAALGVGIAGGVDSLFRETMPPVGQNGLVQVAQKKPAASASPVPASPAPAAAQPASAPAVPKTIPRAAVVRLVRSALVALGQANDTGNYSVLRSLGTPDFQQKNSAEDLAKIFAPSRGIDMGAAASLEPAIASVDDDGQGGLIIKGSLPLQPTPANFMVIYRPVNNVWRLFGLSIANAPPPPMAQAPAAAPTQ